MALLLLTALRKKSKHRFKGQVEKPFQSHDPDKDGGIGGVIKSKRDNYKKNQDILCNLLDVYSISELYTRFNSPFFLEKERSNSCSRKC